VEGLNSPLTLDDPKATRRSQIDSEASREDEPYKHFNMRATLSSLVRSSKEDLKLLSADPPRRENEAARRAKSVTHPKTRKHLELEVQQETKPPRGEKKKKDRTPADTGRSKSESYLADLVDQPPSSRTHAPAKLTDQQLRALIRFQANMRRVLTMRQLANKSEVRMRIAQEVVQTEEFYVKQLRAIVLFYERPLREALRREPVLKEGEIDLVFSEVGNILACHEALLEELRAVCSKWSVLQGISRVFLRLSSALQSCYEIYSANFAEASSFLSQAIDTNQPFRRLLETTGERIRGGLHLSDLLIMPIQRFPHYLLLLDRMLKATPPLHPDLTNMRRAQHAIQKTNAFIDQRAHEGSQVRKLRESLRVIDGLPTLELNTQLVRDTETPVIIGPERALRWVILTSQSLLVARRLPSGILRKFSRSTHAFDLELDLRDLLLDDIQLPPTEGYDPRREEQELTDAEYRLEVERSMQTPARALHEHFRSVSKNDIMAARAKEEIEIAARQAETLQKEVERRQAHVRINRGCLGLEISRPTKTGSITIIMVFDKEEDRKLWREDLLAHQKSRVTTLGRSQKSGKTFVWHIQRQSGLSQTVSSAGAASTPISASPSFLIARTSLGHVTGLAFTIEEKSVRRKSDAEIYSSAKKSNSGLRPLKTGTRGSLGLSVRWNSDVMWLVGTRRRLIHLVLLNHALVGGLYQLASPNTFAIEWMAPFARLTCRAISEPVKANETEVGRLETKIADLERRIGEARTQAPHRGASYSKGSKLPTLPSPESQSELQKLRIELTELQRLREVSRAQHGAEIHVQSLDAPLILVFGSDEGRRTFMQRFEVLQRASLQRLLLLIKKAEESVQRKPGSATDLLQTTSKEVTGLMEEISTAVDMGKHGGPRYVAKMDHLSETEDELVVLGGEEVAVIRKMSSLCWLGTASGIVGALDPRLLFCFSDYGLSDPPRWTREFTDEFVATENQRAEGSFDHLEFYSGEHITVYKFPLSNGMLLGRCQGAIGLIDIRVVKKVL